MNKTKTRRQFLKDSLLLTGSILLFSNELHAAYRFTEIFKRRPNIILLMDDQHRWDHLGKINPKIITPALDELANDGILFDQAVCQAPMCVPSRYSLMLGLYPSQLGVLTNSGRLSDTQLPCHTLPEILKKAGYQTAGFGKTHWSSSGCSTRGFEIRYIGESHENGSYEKGAVMMSDSNPQGLARYSAETSQYGAGEENNTGYIGCTSSVPEQDHRDGWVFNQCMNFISNSIDKNRPLFLYLSFLKPHAGLNVPAGYEDKYDINDITVPPQPLLKQVEPCHATGLNRESIYRDFWSKASPQQWKQMMLRYRANCTWIDSMFSRVINQLKSKGILDNCLIIYTSDHGEMLGERYYRFNKYCLFESSVRVPLIISGQAVPKSKKGTIDHRPAELIDILPTILHAADIKPDLNKPGKNLLKPNKRKAGFCELHDHPDKDAYMWRTSQYKLILVTTKSALQDNFKPQSILSTELYDLSSDPREWNNLSQDNNYISIRQQLTCELITHLKSINKQKLLP